MKHLLNLLQHSRDYTLAVAEAMPANEYTFKPVSTVWNFGELLHHIAYGIAWWEDNYIKEIKTDWNPPAAPPAKTDIKAHLEKTYGALATTVQTTKFSYEAVAGFYATLDHITHHRGQAVTYLRCAGQVPPEYTY
ncbi:DinB family protein [Fulvivirgaceae bacterium PWU5]|uniref:DinB family protein n=1 Tax=Dawidia cretensis TaxID=2782350 RepID=A0AAP2GS42_9BACT|nr:DinB family protein [Dawidia cretensis]MBT1710954.1 DinB family protein [Dawidia cretensis]